MLIIFKKGQLQFVFLSTTTFLL